MNNLLAPQPTQTETALADLDLAALRRDFDAKGFCLARGVFSPAEVAEIQETFAAINAAEQQTRMEGNITDTNDPLARFPRVSHPHRTNETARRYLLHPRVWAVLESLFGEEPVATQSMYYFKPPGARGQAMHQDQFYLMVNPGTCIAAWTAIDRCDAENGGMMVVPETGDADVVCPDEADAKESFTTHFVPVPKGKAKPQLVPMQPGDTLFFNGSAIHGSGPNRSKDRFRRSFIGHYAAGSTDKISHYYLPLVRRDGTDVRVEANNAGGPCGQSWHGAMH